MRKAQIVHAEKARLKWTPEIEALWNSNRTQKDIAAEIGCRSWTLTLAARREGKPPRGIVSKAKPGEAIGATPRPDANLTAKQKADVHTLRSAGYTLNKAVEMVTAPRVKIRFATPANEARA
ncbi:hypothetical protein [Loktanella sp. R86503]|uniref:hypothetical protein n=1 Tax=Loktanella sp. R86503 TaxID=3093847 RepID=UPI0036DE4D1C